MAGPKRRSGKKPSKFAFGGKKRRAPQTLPQYYNQVPVQLYHHGGIKESKGHGSRKGTKWFLFCLLTLFWIGSMILGVLVVAGCTTPSLNKVFLAEMHIDKTSDAYLRFGHFGGCLSVGNPSTPSAKSSKDPVTHCVINMLGIDPEDLGEEFWEDLHLSSAAKSAVQNALNAALPVAVQLQKNVFYWEPPVFQVIFFFVSSIILLVGLTASSPKRAYKATFMLGALLGSFAIGLALTTSIGYTETVNALLATGGAGTEGTVAGATVSIRRGDLLNKLQAALSAVVAVFYVVLGISYVLRRR